MVSLGVVHLTLILSSSGSLKAKRQIIRALKDKIRNKFNVSIAEVDSLDKWQRAELAVACVNSDRSFLNSVLSQVVNFVEREHTLELISHSMELY